MDAMKETLSRTNSQFEKTPSCANNLNQENLKKIILHAKNGVEYTEKRSRLCNDKEQSITVTPIESTISADLYFVQSFRKQLVAKMKQRKGYDKGMEDGHSNGYVSYLSLKDTYLSGVVFEVSTTHEYAQYEKEQRQGRVQEPSPKKQKIDTVDELQPCTLATESSFMPKLSTLQPRDGKRYVNTLYINI